MSFTFSSAALYSFKYLEEIEELKEWISNNPDYQVVGEVKVLGLEEVEVDLAKHMFEMSKNKESVKWLYIERYSK